MAGPAGRSETGRTGQRNHANSSGPLKWPVSTALPGVKRIPIAENTLAAAPRRSHTTQRQPAVRVGAVAQYRGCILPLDTVLLWLALASGVALLARSPGGLWTVKAGLLIAAGVALVTVDPLDAGRVAGAAWLVLVLVPSVLARAANHALIPQRYGLALPLYAAAWVLHPERAYREQVAIVRALALARCGALGAAIAAFGRLAENPRSTPAIALVANFNRRRLEGRLDLLLTEVAWQQNASPLSTMVRLGALASLGRASEVVAVQADQASRLQTPLARRSRTWDFALVSFFVGTGQVLALERLFAGRLRRMPADLRAFQLAQARLASGSGVTDATATLRRLVGSADRDVGLRAERVLARPPTPVVLSPAQEAVVQAAEADLDAMLKMGRTGPLLSRSPVTLLLIGINLAAFAAEIADGGSEDMAALRQLGALVPDLVVVHGQWWRLPAAMFLHFGWLHLSLNMLALAVLGRAVEREMGWWRFLATYLAAGLGSMAGIVLLVRSGWMPDETVLGASGAIMGLFGALIIGAAQAWRRSRSRAARLRLVWMAGLVGVQSALDVATPQVSFAGHALGVMLGMLAGFVLRLGQPPAPVDTPRAETSQPAIATLPRRRVALTMAAGAVAIAAALAFPGRRDRAETRMARQAALRLRPAELASIRQLRFIFVDDDEAGAPAVNPRRPFGSPDPLADLAAATGVQGDAVLRVLFAQVMQHLPGFCSKALLRPGRYDVDGEQVAVSSEQIRLVPALVWNVPDSLDGVASRNGAWPVAFVDFKRPYGDLTYFEADMASALGLPVAMDSQGQADLPEDTVTRLDALHRTMARVMRAFVLHATWPGAS